MKPDNNVPPFNFDAIPLWLRPDLFDETKEIPNRGLWFVGLYLISNLANGLIILGPLAIYMAFGGGNGALVCLAIWLSICIPGGILTGLFVWRDFNRYVRNRDTKCRELKTDIVNHVDENRLS